MEEGENAGDKWITVTGNGINKILLKPKLKPTLHNAFAILSQPDDPTNYNMNEQTPTPSHPTNNISRLSPNTNKSIKNTNKFR